MTAWRANSREPRRPVRSGVRATRRTLLKGSIGLALTTIGPLTLFDAPAAADGALSIGDATIAVVDTMVGPEELWAEVPVRLKATTACTIVLEYETLDGIGTIGVLPGEATAGADFFVAKGSLIFHPGEQVKLVKIRLVRPLEAGKSIVFQISDFGYPLFGLARAGGEVRLGDRPSIATSYVSDDVPLPQLPSHGSVIFSATARPRFRQRPGIYGRRRAMLAKPSCQRTPSGWQQGIGLLCRPLAQSGNDGVGNRRGNRLPLHSGRVPPRRAVGWTRRQTGTGLAERDAVQIFRCDGDITCLVQPHYARQLR